VLWIRIYFNGVIYEYGNSFSSFVKAKNSQLVVKDPTACRWLRQVAFASILIHADLIFETQI